MTRALPDSKGPLLLAVADAAASGAPLPDPEECAHASLVDAVATLDLLQRESSSLVEPSAGESALSREVALLSLRRTLERRLAAALDQRSAASLPAVPPPSGAIDHLRTLADLPSPRLERAAAACDASFVLYGLGLDGPLDGLVAVAAAALPAHVVPAAAEVLSSETGHGSASLSPGALLDLCSPDQAASLAFADRRATPGMLASDPSLLPELLGAVAVSLLASSKRSAVVADLAESSGVLLVAPAFRSRSSLATLVSERWLSGVLEPFLARSPQRLGSVLRGARWAAALGVDELAPVEARLVRHVSPPGPLRHPNRRRHSHYEYAPAGPFAADSVLTEPRRSTRPKRLR